MMRRHIVPASVLGPHAASQARTFGFLEDWNHTGNGLNSDADYRALAERVLASGRLTAESSLKWPIVQPSNGTFDFSEIDALSAWASGLGITVHAHALVWEGDVAFGSSMYPAWVDSLVTPANWQTVLDAHLSSVFGHFSNPTWNVVLVNEPFLEWHTSGVFAEGTFYDAAEADTGTGSDYIVYTFQQAATYNANAKLLLNQHDAIEDWTQTAARRTNMLTWLENWLAAGVRIDGVGLQGHLHADRTFSPAAFRTFLRDLRSLGLDIIITETDVVTDDLAGSDWAKTQAGAQRLGDVLEVCVSEGLTEISFQGLTQDHWWAASPEGAVQSVPGVPYTPHPWRPSPVWHRTKRALQAPTTHEVVDSMTSHGYQYAGQLGNVTQQQRHAQGFTVAGASYAIDRITFWQQRSNTPVWTLQMEIWSDSGGLPDALLAQSDTIASSAVPTTAGGSAMTYVFSTPPVLAPGNYFAVIRNGDLVDSANYIWHYGASSSTHPRPHARWDEGGGAWGVLATDLYFVVQGSAATGGGAPSIFVNQTSVAAGATVQVTVANGPGNTTDWVGLYDASEVTLPSNYIDYQYLNGSTSPPVSGLTWATLTFTMPALAGDYVFYFFENDGYTVLATSETVTVTASGGISAITSRSPTLYYTLDANSASAGTDIGSASLGAITETGTITKSTSGWQLSSGAYLSIGHSGSFETDPAPTTPDQDSYSEVGVRIGFTIPTLADNLPLVSKCDDPDAFGLAWWAEAMADGSVRVHFISHRHNDLVIEAPAGTIVAGQNHVLHIGLGYEGAHVWIDGRQCWSGYKCPLHWYGDDHRVRDIAVAGRNHGGGRVVNTSDIRVGRTGSSGATPGGLTVRHLAAWWRNDNTNQLTTADIQAISEASGAALDYPEWGNSLDTISNGAAASTVQSAIDARSAAGGGTVRLAASGSYSWTSSVVLKDGVRLDLNNSAVTTTSSVSIGVNPSWSAVTDDGGDVASGGTSITGSSIAAAVSPGDMMILVSDVFIDVGWNGTVNGERRSEMVTVRAVSGSTVYFNQPTVWAYSAASRSSAASALGIASGLFRAAPTCSKAAVVNGSITKSGDRPLDYYGAVDCMVADLVIEQSSTATQNYNASRVYDCANLWSPGGYWSRNYATEGAAGWHVYNFVVVGYARGLVFYGAEFYQGDTGSGWDALAHSTGDRIGPTKAQPAECEYIACKADIAASGHAQVVDAHTSSARVRFIDFSLDPTAANNPQAGAPGGGGFLMDGWQQELLRSTPTQSGKKALLTAQAGTGQSYWRGYAGLGQTSGWWAYGRFMNNTAVNCTNQDTTPDLPQGSDQGGLVFVNVDLPRPT